MFPDVGKSCSGGSLESLPSPHPTPVVWEGWIPYPAPGWPKPVPILSFLITVLGAGITGMVPRKRAQDNDTQ